VPLAISQSKYEQPLHFPKDRIEPAAERKKKRGEKGRGGHLSIDRSTRKKRKR